jgi:hypothetical protein
VRRWLAVSGTVLLIATWWTLPIAAASPAPPTPAPGTPPGLQVFLDSDFITPDAPPGGFVQEGFTFWDTRVGDFPNVNDVWVRLHPAKGKAKPSEATIEYDFPGHVLATMEVPQGGPGKVEMGLHLEGKDVPLAISGVGPPPAAPVQNVVTAAIEPLVGDTVAGRAFPLTVEIQPRGLYDFATVPMPDHVVAVARHPGGPGLATAELRPGKDPTRPYTGKLTIPETGPVEIAIQVPAPGGGDYEIPGSVIQRTVIEGGRQSSPPAHVPGSGAPAPASAAPAPASGSAATAAPASPVSSTSDGGIPTIAWVLGIGVLVVIGGLVARRVLADL